MSEVRINWLVVVFVAIAVAIISSLITANITGNVIRVSSSSSGTPVYTSEEVDRLISDLNNQISLLSSRLSSLQSRMDSCCPIVNLVVNSNPSGASVYIDGTYKGLTPLNLSGLTVGRHSIQISLAGYDIYSSEVDIRAGDNLVSTVLQPTQIGTARLSITSNPTSATVYIDGSLRGLTPLNISNLSVGEHTITLVKNGYENYSIVKQLYPGGNSLNVFLTPQTNVSVSTGKLSIRSNPSGASVTLDGAFKGYTPLNISNVQVGRHSVVISKYGYQTYTSYVDITTGTKILEVNLTPISTANATANVYVVSNPSEALVYVDGLYKGLTPLRVTGLSVGSHLIQIVKPGYNVYYVNKTLFAGENRLDVTLTAS